MANEEGVWYHGSPHVVTVLRKGSIITQWSDLAIVHGLRPGFKTLSEDGQRILHNGRGRGYLYEITDTVDLENDVEPVDCALGEGMEWRTLRTMRLRFLCNAEPYPEDLLNSEEVEQLKRKARVE